MTTRQNTGIVRTFLTPPIHYGFIPDDAARFKAEISFSEVLFNRASRTTRLTPAPESPDVFREDYKLQTGGYHCVLCLTLSYRVRLPRGVYLQGNKSLLTIFGSVYVYLQHEMELPSRSPSVPIEIHDLFPAFLTTSRATWIHEKCVMYQHRRYFLVCDRK